MIRQISFDDFGEPIPHAILADSISRIAAEIGATTIKDNDDLDYFEGAALETEGGLRFALMERPGYPAGTVSLCLAEHTLFDDDETADAQVGSVLTALNISNNNVVWRRGQAFSHYPPPRS